MTTPPDAATLARAKEWADERELRRTIKSGNRVAMRSISTAALATPLPTPEPTDA